MSGAMLELDHVRKKFGNCAAVEDLSLSIAKGEFIALMGPSGCGKTTTLRMIAGLERPDSGEIRLWNRRINEDEVWQRDTPLVWQNYALFPFLSVRRNVEFGVKQRSIDARERRAKAQEWLDRLGIGAFAERSIDQLSGGQKQRVALARALATEPKMLLLDEPLSALDPNLRLKMQAELVRLHSELDITFVYITHHQSEAFAMADRVVIMNSGRIVQVGAPDRLYGNPSSRFVAEFLGGSSLFTGRFVGVGDGLGALDSPAGLLRGRSPEPPIKTGDEAVLIVPADAISLHDERTGASNEIEARVVTVERLGAVVTVLLETQDGQELQVQGSLREIAAKKLNPGQPVVAHWADDAGVVLAS
jgi:spermidine/putrescine transport system ATP-binding protein